MMIIPINGGIMGNVQIAGVENGQLIKMEIKMEE